MLMIMLMMLMIMLMTIPRKANPSEDDGEARTLSSATSKSSSYENHMRTMFEDHEHP